MAITRAQEVQGRTKPSPSTTKPGTGGVERDTGLERERQRNIAKIENTSTNQSWKLGTFRLDTQPDGRR